MSVALESAWLLSLPTANTRNAYRWNMAPFLRWCKECNLDVLAAQASDVGKFLDAQVADGYRSATVALRLSALKSFYGYAVETGALAASPMDAVDRVRRSREAPVTRLDEHATYALADYLESGVRRYVPPVVRSRRRAVPEAREILRGSPCGWCGKAWDETFHVDHIVAIARGGSHHLDNLTASCARCNLRKGAKDWGWPPHRAEVVAQ